MTFIRKIKNMQNYATAIIYYIFTQLYVINLKQINNVCAYKQLTNILLLYFINYYFRYIFFKKC